MTKELDFDIEIIGEEPMEKEKEMSKEDLFDLPHPLEQFPSLLDLVDKYFPDKGYKQLLIDSVKPKISENPDEVESWEAEVILRRKQPLPVETITGEPNLTYLIRLLYEETFSVRQFQGKMRGSEGITPGGLISHHYFNGINDGVSIETAATINIKENTLKDEFERLVKENDFEGLNKLVILTTELGFPPNYYIEGHTFRMRLALLRTKKYIPSDILESMGFRAMIILNENPELLEKSENRVLQNICQYSHKDHVVFGLHRLWGILSRSVFKEGGYYKTDINDELLAALEQLILFRTHSQTQSLYKYLSPSGYINSRKTKKEALPENK